MAAADLVVTLGKAMKANIVAAGIPAEKILIAPNAVGGDFLAEPLEPSAPGVSSVSPKTGNISEP